MKMIRMMHTVETYGGVLPITRSFNITFKRQTEDPCLIWRPESCSPFVLTLFGSPSGTGKTSFLGDLYKRLRGNINQKPYLVFAFRPDYEGSAASVGYIPQHPPMVNHWRLEEILPINSKFLGCFFPREERMAYGFWKKRIGEFSGGQRRKLYACSSLDRLLNEEAHSSFILFDETFDGLGANEASQCLSSIRDTWTNLVERPLYVLVVTHLNDVELVGSSISALKIGLETEINSSDELIVKIFNKL